MRYTLGWLAALTGAALVLAAPPLQAVPLAEARIFIELHHTDQDVGAHVFLDGPPWAFIEIFDPGGSKLARVKASGSMGVIGLSELFFEGEEPSLEDVPLEEFLALFPEGKYRFRGQTVDGMPLTGAHTFTHDIPDGPVILTPSEGEVVDPDNVVISWQTVTSPPGIDIVGYQVIVGSFQITLSETATSIAVPAGFLEPGSHELEVLAIEVSGNQTISSSSFVTE